MSYSQNREDEFVLRYFKNFKGTLLEIGANDGQTLSNSNLLIQYGWAAHLVEPASVFADLQALHANNPKVKCYNFGIGICTGGGVKIPFYESANHIPGGSDRGLVSSIHANETDRWRKAGVQFSTKSIQLYNFMDFWDEAGFPDFDFISIDVEGCDLEILQQIDFAACRCKCLCIEWNSDYELYRKFVDYCAAAGLVLRVQNAENLIFCRP